MFTVMQDEVLVTAHQVFDEMPRSLLMFCFHCFTCTFCIFPQQNFILVYWMDSIAALYICYLKSIIVHSFSLYRIGYVYSDWKHDELRKISALEPTTSGHWMKSHQVILNVTLLYIYIKTAICFITKTSSTIHWIWRFRVHKSLFIDCMVILMCGTSLGLRCN